MTTQTPTVIDLDVVQMATYEERYAKSAPYRPMAQKDAWRYAVGDALSLHLKDDTSFNVAHPRWANVTLQTSDTLDAASLRTIMNAKITHGGRTFVFSSMDSGADHYEYYGSPTTESWIEITSSPTE